MTFGTTLREHHPMAASVNPHMHEIFVQRYCMKWVPWGPTKGHDQLTR